MPSRLPTQSDAQIPSAPDGTRRRSKRVLLSIAISVSGTSANGQQFQEETKTLVVNAHGALVALATRVKVGDVLVVVNKATNQAVQFRVMYQGNAQAEKTQFGLEFLNPTPYFWQLDFPPDDWVVPET
jgi:hypothetical protein